MEGLPKGLVSCSRPDACAVDCRGRRYTCRRCLRFVPWCFGGHDGTVASEWCDDCWADVASARYAFDGDKLNLLTLDALLEEGDEDTCMFADLIEPVHKIAIARLCVGDIFQTDLGAWGGFTTVERVS